MLGNRILKGAINARALSGAATTQSGQIQVDDTLRYVNLQIVASNFTGTAPSLTLSVQWSIDGTNWSTLDGGAESFAAITANGSVIKQLTPKAPYLRFNEVLGGTTPTATYTVNAYLD